MTELGYHPKKRKKARRKPPPASVCSLCGELAKIVARSDPRICCECAIWGPAKVEGKDKEHAAHRKAKKLPRPNR
jgi:hypothetical protein